MNCDCSSTSPSNNHSESLIVLHQNMFRLLSSIHKWKGKLAQYTSKVNPTFNFQYICSHQFRWINANTKDHDFTFCYTNRYHRISYATSDQILKIGEANTTWGSRAYELEVAIHCCHGYCFYLLKVCKREFSIKHETNQEKFLVWHI